MFKGRNFSKKTVKQNVKWNCIAAARAQYVLSFVIERGTCLKYKDWCLINK